MCGNMGINMIINDKDGVSMKRMIRKTSQKKSRRGLRKRLSFLELVRLAVDLPLGYSPSIGNKY
ncbi:MAG: hypothetical protein A2Y00_02680 [Omnitrophica WOR_2 bacterium GWF2_43_52]|nr:MAG: hypothetical protein A2Y01_02590 [Omnitrophica WOR_2 bacterium GWC2_44_8]OGX20342.1 MAG: hypothetical protein A2Y00_02680 [Omnitrophica WOR_2 bacterium GWF2_43_52]OGX56357.1 MAG: hypothetical protein A2460_03320 [Omnitrophica WOR_2 bacterium RIFOXYC2_FULL_43_9]HAH21222.1 hypothetical protein [Candidatus Omnitrophota bacterium]HBG63966.1 hypothetical protein [Candidatus Omnitrophota bacterium]